MRSVAVSSTSAVQSAGTAPEGFTKTAGAGPAVVVGASVVVGEPGTLLVGATVPPVVLKVARMASRIDAWPGSVIWISSNAVNAWLAGLAAITWYSAVPSSPHPVSMRCDPANTPSSYG